MKSYSGWESPPPETANLLRCLFSRGEVTCTAFGWMPEGLAFTGTLLVLVAAVRFMLFRRRQMDYLLLIVGVIIAIAGWILAELAR